MLRIAMATNRYSPSVGGIERHVQRLAETLAAAGDEVTVLTHDLDGGDPGTEVRNGVTVRRFLPLLPNRHYLASPGMARHLATSADRYDIVHAHGYHDTPAAMAAMFWRGPLVFSPHYHGASESHVRNLLHVPYRFIGRRIFDRADAVLCVSSAEREAVLARFDVPECTMHIVSNGVDVEPAPLRPHPGSRRLLAVVGRLDHYKRVDRVVAAMPALADEFVLEICGDGAARKDLEQQVADLGLSGCVQIRGRVSDTEVASLIRSAACVISMSELEAQGIVLLEAAATGTPSVASAIPAHIDVCKTIGGAVTLVAPGADARAVGQAIRTAARRPRQSRRVPTWADVAASVVGIYNGVAGGTVGVPETVAA